MDKEKYKGIPIGAKVRLTKDVKSYETIIPEGTEFEISYIVPSVRSIEDEYFFIGFSGNQTIPAWRNEIERVTKQTNKTDYIKIEDKNDLLCMFGYASHKQAVANHKKLTK